MIKTIPLDIFLSLIVGLVFALSAAPLLEKEESMINTYFIRALMFQVLIFLPIGLFLAWKWTAWSWMYLVEPHSHGKFWTWLAVLSYVPAMIAGFHIGYMCIRTGKKGQANWYLAGASLAVVLITVGMLGRLYHVSNNYLPPSRISEAPGWFGNGWFMLSMLVITVVFVGGLSYVLRLNAADRERTAREAFPSPAES